MTVIQGFTDIYKQEVLKGNHDFENDVIKGALYTDGVTLDHTTLNYSVTDEVVATGYTAGGFIIPCTVSLVNGRGVVDAQNVTLNNFIERDVVGMLIYNSSLTTNNAIAVVSLDRAVIQGDMTVQFELQNLIRF